MVSRRRKNRVSYDINRPRDVLYIPRPPRLRPVSRRIDLTQISDKRRFSPHRPNIHRDSVRPTPYSSPLLGNLNRINRSQDIHRAVVCTRRQRRKEVLHATRKAGKVGYNKPRWSPESYKRCKK